jgi:hypothetical protein
VRAGSSAGGSTRALLRAAATAIIAALAGVVWLVLFYNQASGLRFDLHFSPPPAIVRGLYATETDPDTRVTFAWASETLTLALDDVDRQVEWALDIRLRGARAGGAANPVVEFFVDGIRTPVVVNGAPVDAYQSGAGYESVRLTIPPQPAASRLAIEVRASNTFVPGPGDRRTLGFMVDRIAVEPAGIVLPPRAAFQGAAVAAAAMGVAIALLGVTAGSAIGGAILLGAAIGAIVAHGSGPYTDYPGVAARAAIWTALAVVTLTAAAAAIRGSAFRNTARFAIAFSAAAFLAKLLILLHPDMPIGDALFQAHRFQEVVAGRWYFTSLAPGNYRFPYAPGLYLTALPFAGLVRRGAADMTLLRTIVCASDVLAGLLVYGMAQRIRGDRVAGAIAVALYHLIPIGFAVVGGGHHTNAIAQSLSVAALALIASTRLRWEHRVSVALLAAVLFAAFVSHTSAFAIVSVASLLIALLFVWRGGPALRSPAAAVVVATTAAIVAAVAIYYAHFLDTYRTELTRISSETAAAAPDAGGRGIAERLASVPRYLVLYYSIPMLVLWAAGAALLWNRGARDRVTLSCAGWFAGCLVFWIAGILTPVDMRHYLASVPTVAVLGGAGAAIAWTSGTQQRAATGVVLGWAVVAGIHAWWSTLN